jgi:quercetin dioxygenase-like cupin family protein
MRSLAPILLGCIILLGCLKSPERTPSQQANTPTASQTSSGHALNVKLQDAKWNKFAPQIGEDSPEIAILHVDSTSHATQLLIRVPSGFTVPAHWHSANETHTVVEGTFILECEGVRDTLTAGSFNYIPKRMAHQAWTPLDQGALLFITVDGPWDVNFVNGPPDWSKLRNPAAKGRRRA